MKTVSSVTAQSVISLLLVSEQYAQLVQQQGHPTDCRVSDELDELLTATLQQYEQSSQQYETYCTEKKLDELFLEASQLLVIELLDNSLVVKPSGKQQVDFEPLDNPDTKMSSPAVNHWLQRFVIEVRKVSGECYSPDSLHQIGCGVQTAQ